MIEQIKDIGLGLKIIFKNIMIFLAAAGIIGTFIFLFSIIPLLLAIPLGIILILLIITLFDF